jgi:multiple sugar transport system substrate-binding protein
MRTQAMVLAVTLVMAPPGAEAADLVVWWEQGFYAQEDEAVREIIAAFEQETGKEVELVQPTQHDLPAKARAAIEAGQPPDFVFGIDVSFYMAEWAFRDRLVDLSKILGSFTNMFDPDALNRAMLANGKTGQKALYGLPMGRSTNHVHIWKSLLEQAGFSLADIPRESEAFWSFWCDDVQPAARSAMGRDDIWGVGLPMSEWFDTEIEFLQFMTANKADYVTRDGSLVIDDSEIRQKLVKAIDSYTAIYRKGCTPPDSVTWDTGAGNNEAFHGHRVVMTPNPTLSIPNTLKRERTDDYYKNVATIEWPLSSQGEPFAIFGDVFFAMVFKGAGNVGTAEEFVRFLVGEGWLAHYLDFAGERMLPPMSKLLDAPFWLDPSDPHRMASVMQVNSRPLRHNYAAASGNWRHSQVFNERVWAKAVHRIVTEGISPEQAVDEAIARIQQILSE